MLKFNVIKLDNIDFPISEECINVLPRGYGFKGSTHSEYRIHGNIQANKDGQNFGYIRTKEGEEYWVLPYIDEEGINKTREIGGVVVSWCLTEVELLNFGFDVPEDV